jgi:aspartate kinase
MRIYHGEHSIVGILYRMLLHEFMTEELGVMMISTSEIKISCIIESKYTELAVRALHEAFQLDRKVFTK